jgi:hypothetical protein
MTQTPRFVRARQLTASVLPGRRTDGYPDVVSGRMRKIAAASGTGILPFSGRCDGAIYFREGKVVYAESGRTPGAPAHAHRGPADAVSPLGKIIAILAVTEPTVDAVLELLSGESRYSKFRPDRLPANGFVSSIPLEDLLTEVTRRQRFLKQLSPMLTADTAVARNPHIRSDAIRISALQWALLIRVRHGSTPRDLAWDLSRSVFGTTAEIYRLLALRLLRVAGHREIPENDLGGMSFVRAVAVKKGDRMPLINAGATLGDVD